MSSTKRIAIVNNGTLPLPAVRGGAVETLIQLLIDNNEKYHELQFEIYSIYDKNAVESSKKYQYSTFHFVKVSRGTIHKMKEFLRMIANSISKRFGFHFHPNDLIVGMVSDIRKRGNNYVDAIVLEGARINASYVKRKTGLPVIQRIHNVPQNSAGRWDIENAQATDLYLGISNFICQILKRFEGKYCKNIELLYNSVDFKLFDKNLSREEWTNLRKSMGLAPDDFVIVFTGRLQEYKGIRQLVQAVANCKDIENLKLLIVGSNTFSSEIKTEFEEALYSMVEDNKEKFVFTGYVDYKDIYRYYKIADLAVLPSTWEEPFALTCLEALVCGLPVVITRSGGMPEIVDDKCAAIVENDENLVNSLEREIRRLYDSPATLSMMASHAKRRASLFNGDNHYKRFSNLIKGQLDESSDSI